MTREKAKVLATAATVGRKAQVWLTSMEDALKVDRLYALCSMSQANVFNFGYLI